MRIVQFQKISIPTLSKIIGNFQLRERGVLQKTNFFKDTRSTNTEISRGVGWEAHTKKISMGGVWIFSGTTHYNFSHPKIAENV